MKIVKNTILNYVPNKFETESLVNQARIFSVNDCEIKSGNIIYLCEREIRPKDNFALQFALQKSKELNLPLKIFHPKFEYWYEPKQNFIDNQVNQAKKLFDKLNLDFEISEKSPSEIVNYTNPALLIVDFNPILKRDYLTNMNFRIYEIDSHNIVPARFVSDRQEYNAATLRRKIYFNIFPFITEFENSTAEKVEADLVLENFLKDKLQYYSEFKNDLYKNVLSGLSKYLNLGFISAQRIVLEVIKSDVSKENKESFLEELIIRKELADNFCLYANNFKNFSSIPEWAKLSLESHKFDIRQYIYTAEELENAQTHDELWNIAQNQLVKSGIIHGYLRMYWAKKLLEWAVPEEALKIAIYLNDKYAYDAPSANGYTGILWSLGGLHDRAFIDYPVTGKIRRMTVNSVKKHSSEFLRNN